MTTLRTFVFAACLGLAAPLAAASDDVADGTDPADEQPAASAAEEPKTDAASGEFKPPPGFKTKKRGALVLYCIRDSTVGTRFKTEKCYDEAQMRDYMAAQQENKRDIDRVRSTCSTGSEFCVRY